jgi:hydrogenase expression/formation protein HypC
MLCPEAKVGDHVLVHAGYAITCIDRAEAEATLALLDEALARERALAPELPPVAGGAP